MSPKQKMQKALEDLRPLLTTDWHSDGVRVTEAVVAAVGEVLDELRRPRSDWYRVAALLSCKSYLCGAVVEAEPFCEDRDHNEAVLGDGVSVYSLLDGLQFEAAMMANVMPAGMTAYTAQGKCEERYRLDVHSPTMQSIALAERRVHEHCDARADGKEEADESCKPS